MNLYVECSKISDPQAASLHAMANFTVFANNNRHRMNKYLLCVDLFAPLTQRLASCDNLEDIYHITVCLSSLNRLVTQDSVRLYTTKLKELVASGKLSRDSDTIIISKVDDIRTKVKSTNHFFSYRFICRILPDIAFLEFCAVVVQ